MMLLSNSFLYPHAFTFVPFLFPPLIATALVARMRDVCCVSVPRPVCQRHYLRTRPGAGIDFTGAVPLLLSTTAAASSSCCAYDQVTGDSLWIELVLMPLTSKQTLRRCEAVTAELLANAVTNKSFYSFRLICLPMCDRVI